MSDCKCGRATRDDAFVCEDCLGDLNRALGDIPWLTTELDTTLTRTRGVDYRALGGAKATETPLPMHLKAGELQAELRAILVAWVKFCAEDGITHQSPTVALPRDNATSMSRWLMWRVDGLAYNELGSDAVTEITGIVNRGTRIIDRPADRWFAGPCDECQEDLYAASQVGDIKCRNCGTGFDIAERREWLIGEAEDRLATAAVIAGAVPIIAGLHITADRIYKWKQRGQILDRGHDGANPLYRVGDVIDLMTMGPKKFAAKG